MNCTNLNSLCLCNNNRYTLFHLFRNAGGHSEAVAGPARPRDRCPEIVRFVRLP